MHYYCFVSQAKGAKQQRHETGIDNESCNPKALRLARSSVHDWGLFAEEPIDAEEFVIE
jgi:SET domain-containing protein